MMTSRRLKSIFSLILISFLISGLILQGTLPTFSYAASNITSDGTMGTIVSQTGTTYNISGGTIKGTNQFQSFGLFSVGTGDTASFNGPVGILNIIGRVTGGQQSIIDGILKSTISGANLYLLNPYGVLFGKNATLSVTGSFHVSTADYLRFNDGARFYANLSNNSTLTSAPIAAFGFLTNPPAPITIQESFLQVPRYKTLSVIGGDLNITGGPSGYLYAPSGRINLASVASPGEVIPIDSRDAPDLQLNSFDRLGNINLSNLAYLSTDSSAGNGTVVIRGGRISVDNSYIIANTLGSANGASIGIDINVREDFIANKASLQASTTGAGRGGDIFIKSANLDMKNISTIEAFATGAGSSGNLNVETGNLNLTQGSQIKANTRTSGSSGDITIKADRVFITGAEDTTRPTSILNIPNTGSTGRGGNLQFTVGSLELLDGAQIYTTNYGSGNGGVVEVNADSVILSGRNALNAPAGIFSNAQSSGKSGGVRITTESLEVRKGAQITTSSFSSGNSGNLEVTADRILLTEDNSGFATGLFARGYIGDGGDIRINTGSLEVMGGATISASSRRSGVGGDIEVTADSILLSGVNQKGNRSGIYNQSESLATGAAGDIKIKTGSLEVKDGAQITVAALGPGNAGSLEVTANSVLISGSKNGYSARLNSSTETNAKGGKIKITTNDLEVEDGAKIWAITYGSGDAGTIEITADRVLVSGVSEGIAARISAQADTGSSGRGGNILITTNRLEVRDGSEIGASTNSTGDAGTIIINAKNIFLDGGTNPVFGVGLFASTEWTGNAGGIQIETKTLEMKGGAQIGSFTRSFGNGGNIEINAENITLSGVTETKVQTLISCGTDSSGRGGDIIITTGSLNIKDGTSIDSGASSSGDAGRITITAGALDLSNGGHINSSTNREGAGGNIKINAGQVQLSNNAFISADSLGTGSAGNVEIKANHLDARNEAQINVSTSGAGNAGNINVEVNSLNLTDGAIITCGTYGGTGSGGDIMINATENILISGEGPSFYSGLYSTSLGQGNAGNINISTPSLIAENKALINADTFGNGRGGNIDIKVDTLNLSGGAYISSSTHPPGMGAGGNVTINAGKLVSISGGSLGGIPSSILSIAIGDGDAGNIIISSPQLNMNGGFIGADTMGDGLGGSIDIKVNNLNLSNAAMISSGTHGGAGKGGTIEINATDTMSISGRDSGLYSISMGPGTGGNIETTSRNVFLTDRSTISASSTGLGDAGNIDITVADSLLMRNSSITTEAKQADGGNIHIHAGYMVNLIDSVISASVGGGPETVGGNITIDPQYVILNDSQIIANAYEGKGGNIQITADVYLASPDSVVDASSALGIDGTVDIQAPISSISGTLSPMQGNFLSTEALLGDRCIAKIRGERISSFVVSGRDGLPIRPGSVLPSPIY